MKSFTLKSGLVIKVGDKFRLNPTKEFNQTFYKNTPECFDLIQKVISIEPYPIGKNEALIYFTIEGKDLSKQLRLLASWVEVNLIPVI